MKNPYFNLIRTVWRYGQPWHRTIVGYYLTYIVAQGILSLSPYTFGRTIDVLQHFTPERFNEVIFWLGAGIASLLFFWLLHGPARVIERKVALKIQQKFRVDLYEKLTQLPLKWHQDHHSGNVISRLNRASLALRRFAEDQFMYIETIIKFIVSIGFLTWISVPVGVLSLLSCTFAFIVVIAFDRKLIPLYQQQNEIENHVSSILFDYISNMTTILTLRLGELTKTHLFKTLLRIWEYFNPDALVNEFKWFAMGTLLTILEALILIGYIMTRLNTLGAIELGLVVMIFRYQWELREVFIQLSMTYSMIVHSDTDIKDLKPILDDIEKWAHIPQGAALASHWQKISIEDLDFHHAKESKKPAIHHLSFEIKRGEKIALIGPSGGGKSTLLNLLSNLYTPNHVRLSLDGNSFESLEPLLAITTLIPQDPEMFENTIEFNIALDLEATPNEIQRAIDLAQFSSVIDNLPAGIKTDIREKGLNLSVGQKQRLALARGLFAARLSSLILMDEPTSSVDLPTEKEILSGIINAFPDSAMIVSLHRLHLLPKFDKILLLKNGVVQAFGPTQDLLNQPGPVFDLWKEYST